MLAVRAGMSGVASGPAQERTLSDGVLEDLLVLEELDTNLYRAGNPAERSMPHLYGGQVAAQALASGRDTVPEGRYPHSIHGYFLRGGRPDHPTIMAVDRDRDGGSFSARHVNALQDGEVIFERVGVVPHRRERHRLPAAEPARRRAGDPDSMPEHERVGHNAIFDLRYVLASSTPNPGAASRMWAAAARPSSPTIASRARARSRTSPTWGGRSTRCPRRHGIGGPSLDHAVWFHRSVTVNQWMLLDLHPVSVAARAACTSERSTTERARSPPRSRRRSCCDHRVRGSRRRSRQPSAHLRAAGSRAATRGVTGREP